VLQRLGPPGALPVKPGGSRNASSLVVSALRSESAIVAGIAKASLPKTATPWEEYAADYNRLRDKMAEAIEGFECFNRRARQPLGFRLEQPARELVFLTNTGRANFSLPPLADAAPSL